LLVFDLSCRASFESLRGWLEEARRFGCVPARAGENARRNGGGDQSSGRSGGEAVIYLVGNKSDCARAVKSEEAQAFATANGLKYFETSACSGENVTSVFEELFDDVSVGLGYRRGSNTSSEAAKPPTGAAPEEER
jgi:DnaJ family protein C protein 27